MIKEKKYFRMLFLFFSILVILSLISISLGRLSINPLDVVNVIYSKIKGVTNNSPMNNVVFYIRIPRTLSAILVGSSLAISGAIYQSTFRNPLVSPDLLGVSSGASVGAALAIIIGVNLYFVQLFAFIGGLLAVLIATTFPKLLKNTSNMMLILSGIIVSSFMSSLLGIIKFLAEEQTELSTIVFWQMGSLSNINKSQLLSVFPLMSISIILVFFISWQLNIISLGEDEAKTVGINTKRTRAIFIILASILTASSVSVSGTIGWIGLVIPHFGRLLVGSNNTKLLPIAAILGGGFLLVIDTVARTITTMEIPLSILSGLIGAPIYVWLLNKQRNKIL